MVKGFFKKIDGTLKKRENPAWQRGYEIGVNAFYDNCGYGSSNLRSNSFSISLIMSAPPSPMVVKRNFEP
jgi:hypothetical protein